MKFLLTFLIGTIFIFPNGKLLNESIQDLPIQSENYILYSLDTDEVIAKKNNDVHLAGASINKVLTVLTALDYIDEVKMDEVFTVDPKIFENVAEEAAVAGFYPSQRLSLRDVLYGVMLPSGADAAIILSFQLFDSSDGIVEAMNKKAKAIGMTDTHIVNQIGLDDDNQYTTLDDLLLLLKTALADERFYEIYTSSEYQLSQEDVVIFDGILIQTVDYDAPYIIGAKSGYTIDAGRALSSLGDNDEMRYILITTQAEGEYYENNGALEDAVAIYDYLFTNFNKKIIVSKGLELDTLKVKYHYEEIPLVIPEEIEAIIHKEYKEEDIKVELIKNEALKAPLEVNEKLGSYKVSVDNVVYYEGDILLTEALSADYLDQIIIIVPIVLVVLLIGTIVIFKRRKSKL